MRALICTAAPFTCAYESAIACAADSCAYSIGLDEIVVKASPVINKIDRRVIRPDRETIMSSTDGLNLLGRLHLPRITINPLTGEITAAGGGEVVVCINGIEATPSQIAAIQPQNILRIEYHDNPGIRYAGAAVVIDYITSRHDCGGALSLDAFGAFAGGRYATIDHLAAQFSKERSSWSINLGYMGQRKNKWIRDYDETWHLPDATVTRHETGLPVTVGGAGLESSADYNHIYPSGDILSLRIGLDFSDIPNLEEGDRRGILVSSATDTPVIVAEHTEEHSVTPAIRLYYMHKLSGGSSLLFDAGGSYMRSRSLHEYSENGAGELNRVTGDKYAFRFRGLFENRVGSRVWSAGLSNSSSFIENCYRQDVPAIVRVNSSVISLAGEYSDRFRCWGILANARIEYRHLGQSIRNIDKVFFTPSFSVSYRPSDRLFLRYTASLDHTMPTAAEISNIGQSIQTGMIRRGNPQLRPFRVVEQSFTASFTGRFLNIEPRVEYRNCHNPVMESIIFEDGGLVRTFFNQRSFQRLTACASVSIRPWGDHISITAQPCLTRYFSHGIDYRHTRNIFRIGLGIDFSYGHWIASANIMSGPANSMYGEEIIEETDMNQIIAGYKKGFWSLQLGVFNAFIKNYRMQTANLSALAPYTSKAHSGRSSSYLAVKLNITLDFGHRLPAIDIPDTPSDSDSGILTVTK